MCFDVRVCGDVVGGMWQWWCGSGEVGALVAVIVEEDWVQTFPVAKFTLVVIRSALTD